MPSAAVQTSIGTTIAFADSSFSAEILDIGLPEISREALNVSHVGTSAPAAGSFGSKEFIPHDFVDAGTLTMELHFNPDTDPPIHADAEQITITWKDGATWVFTGFFTNFSVSAPLRDKMTASATVKISGAIAHTDA